MISCSSLPALCRQSRAKICKGNGAPHFMPHTHVRVVLDARNKPGHDEFGGDTVEMWP